MNTEHSKKTTQEPASFAHNAWMTLAVLAAFGAAGGLLWLAETWISG